MDNATIIVKALTNNNLRNDEVPSNVIFAMYGLENLYEPHGFVTLGSG